jgi:hypothetical protein
VTNVNKRRLIYVLLFALLFAYMLACVRFGHPFGRGMSDGGGH